MTGQSETVTDNPAWADARPELSVLIPFKGDDPSLLLRALARDPGARAEILVLDDGTGDDALAARVAEQIQGLGLPARFIRLAQNEGRSRGRNRLVRHARGAWFLFLDSDMLPDDPHFLGRWLELVEHEGPPVAFGGFSLKQCPTRPEHALHRQMAAHSDCLGPEERQQAPEKSVFTSNLLVRRDVFEAERFNEDYTGWGWEDVEWGMRVLAHWPILHIDNTATHLGLDTARTLATKYEQSAGNFGRLVKQHRDIVSAYPSYRAARLLKFTPLRPLWRPWLKAIALAEGAPLKARAFAMRLYRAALYAEQV